MKIQKLDPGTLARILGDNRANPSAPDELAPTVVGVLDLTPFLIPPTAVGLTGAAAAESFPFSVQGRLGRVDFTVPAAGAELSLNVPENAVWEIVSLFARFTPSATVVQRGPRLVVDAGLNFTVALVNDSGLSFGAGTVKDIYWARGINSTPGSVSVNEHGRDIPHLFFAGPRWTIRTVTGNIQPGDQWNFGRLLVREWGV